VRVARVELRVYGALGDFLPPARRGAAFALDVHDRTSVKDAIEAAGVPHCEVFLVLADGEPAAFGATVRDGQRVAVYPHFDSVDIGELAAAGAPRPPLPRFVLDGHLGRLAAYLRALGFDVRHRRDADDAELAATAADEDRVLLTRDVGLLKRGAVRHGAWVRAVRPREQVDEVVRRFRLAPLARPFTRCLRCNTPLRDATPAEVAARVPPRVRARFDAFLACPDCARVFWRGTHHAHLVRTLDGMKAGTRPDHSVAAPLPRVRRPLVPASPGGGQSGRVPVSRGSAETAEGTAKRLLPPFHS
jgi:uncharacterized protein with PIN domain